jgi:hypothetical protein
VRSATFEAGDGKSMRFDGDPERGGHRGEGGRGGRPAGDGSLAVRAQTAERESLTLPGQPIFPSEHMKRSWRRAGGANDFAIKVYDGSDTARRSYETYALIGGRIDPAPAHEPREPARQEAVAKLARWPVTISYYPWRAGTRPLPIPSPSSLRDGISRALKLNYGDFA